MSAVSAVAALPVATGKYLVTPLVRTLENGWFTCSVSIRSGSGRGTTDRVVRFTKLFRDLAGAADYALAEGLQWVATGTGQARPV